MDDAAIADTAAEPKVTDPEPARRRHYGVFYGLDPEPTGFGVVMGNCQAESLRIVLDSPATPTVRVPPVHEMTAEDAGLLHALLPRAAFLVSQPIRADYRDLPLGTAQMRASLGPAARAVTVPSVRYAGLYPFQVALRVPGTPGDPPIVAYHDVRDLAAAGGVSLLATLGREAVRAIGADSQAELRRREQATDVRASDLFDAPAFGMMRTVNHAGNDVWLPLGERVLAALGSSAAVTDPGRPLLAAVQAPREEWVVAAWDASGAPCADWVVDGATVAADVVRDAHARWYADNPRFVTAALDRLAPLLGVWGAA